MTKQLKCPVCGKEFKTRNAKRAHMHNPQSHPSNVMDLKEYWRNFKERWGKIA